jgi:hypothetical protein
MKINNITKMVEQVVRVEYIAADGTVFASQTECEAYEASALFVASQKVNGLRLAIASEYDFVEAGSEENTLEVFYIQTQEDLDALKQYLYLRLSKNRASEKTIKECFEDVNGTRANFVFSNVTPGHEVMIFWSYDEDWFWVYGDGSIDAYCEWARMKYRKMLQRYQDENKKEEKSND